jgi:ABC-2 type transport system permease protein
VVTTLAVPIAVALEQPLPASPALYAAAALLAVVMFTAFAYWTAAWTRSAEAAQLTSMPLIIVVSLGPFGAAFTGVMHDLVTLTPGFALTELVRIGWFGFDGSAATALLVIVAWTVLATVLAKRSMRWEPRT